MTQTTSITLDTKAFTRELEWCARFIEKKTTIPILSNALFRKRGDLLYLSGTDLELGGLTSIETRGEEGPDWELTAPVHVLLKYLKKVEERTLAVEPVIRRLAPLQGPHPIVCEKKCCCDLGAPYASFEDVTSVAIKLTHGDDSIHVEGMRAIDYPELPARPLATMQLGGLKVGIPRAVSAITTEESRFTLSGALLTVKDKAAHLISTDGHRLSVVDLIAYDPAEVRALIPKTALNELARLGDSAFFSADDHHVFFAVGERSILARKMTGNFPDWERVLPKDLKYSIAVESAPFRKTLDRVAVCADERSHSVCISVGDECELWAETMDRGKARGKVAITPVRKFHGPDGWLPLPDGLAYPYATGFNAEYLTDFLKAAGDTAYFHFQESAKAAEWYTPGWRYLIMPMRGLDSGDPCERGAFQTLQWARDEELNPPAIVIEEAIAPVIAIDESPRIAPTPIRIVPVAPVTSSAPIDISDLRTRAIALRRQKVSLSAIAKQLNAPQSSVWRWTRGA